MAIEKEEKEPSINLIGGCDVPKSNSIDESGHSWGFQCHEREIKIKYSRNICQCDRTCIFMIAAALIALLSYVTTPEVEKPIATLLDQSERARLLHMLNHTSTVLTAHNITHWLDFGSLLGAVRNGRIIDWDDDGEHAHDTLIL
jgi:hypothetical protein